MGEEFIPYQATIGVDFTYIENKIKDEENPKKFNRISLQIWDTCNLLNYIKKIKIKFYFL